MICSSTFIIFPPVSHLKSLRLTVIQKMQDSYLQPKFVRPRKWWIPNRNALQTKYLWPQMKGIRKNNKLTRPQTIELTCGISVVKLSSKGTWLSPPS